MQSAENAPDKESATAGGKRLIHKLCQTPALLTEAGVLLSTVGFLGRTSAPWPIGVGDSCVEAAIDRIGVMRLRSTDNQTYAATFNRKAATVMRHLGGKKLHWLGFKSNFFAMH